MELTRAGKLTSVTQYLNTEPSLSRPLKGRIRAHMRAFAASKGLPGGRDLFSRLNARKREMFADAIFLEEDRLESRDGGQPDHPVVLALNRVRNRVLDDLGWNEA